MIVKHKCLVEISAICIRVLRFDVSFFLKTEHALLRQPEKTSSGERTANTEHTSRPKILCNQMKRSSSSFERMYNEMLILFSLLHEYFLEMITLLCVINLAELRCTKCALISRRRCFCIVIYSISIDDLSSKIRKFIVWGKSK